MNNRKTCPICSNLEQEKVLSCKDFTVSKEEFYIVKCRKCGFHFTNPIPEKIALASYYESEEYISHSNTNNGFISKIYQSVRKHTLTKKAKLVSTIIKGKKVLDIGCGTGEFLLTLQERGFEVLGVEPSSLARNQAIELGLSVEEEKHLNEIQANSFDLISMWHVLEHVYDLKERVKEINKILSKDGKLIIAVPNRMSFDASYYKKYWAAYDVPRHLYHFTEKDLKQLFGDFGFKLEKTLPMWFDSFYVSMLSEKYKKTSLGIFRAILIGLWSNAKAILSKNPVCSSQIYIFSKN